ncbi:MAG: site-specific DNA-methyltransferase [Spirochaetota bacterium]|jgi:site-specific DNA-methyltransferase (adenine-specific)|nr:site-specific DNA-methyltransferase [Spirochaetota bacterium]
MNLRIFLDEELEKHRVIILPVMDVKESMRFLQFSGYRPAATILDPWYNRGIGGVRDDYFEYMLDIIDTVKYNTNHLFLWGFPEIAAQFINKINEPLEFVAWLTWFFKNCPSVIRGWRSSQQTCLHYAVQGAKMYPENFFNAEQELRFENNQMRFIPAPSSVIEESLLVGFVGKKEQTGHPAQKPEKVYEKLVLMSSAADDLIYDPMAGSGTTGAVCITHRRRCIISDISDEYIFLAEKRLGIKRLSENIIDEYRLEMAQEAECAVV